MTEQEAIWYLAGVFDGEGSVPAPGRRYLDVTSSTDPVLIAATVEALTALNFHVKVNESGKETPKHARCEKVRVNRRLDQQRFFDIIPFRSQLKRDRFRAFLDSR